MNENSDPQLQQKPFDVAPSFIEPTKFIDLSDEDQLTFLEDIRDKRMIAVTYYQAAQNLKAKVKNETLQLKIEKVSVRIEKEIEKIDGVMDKVQLLSSQVKALRIQAIALEDIE